MMSESDNDRATLARLIPEAQRLADDPASLVQWMATLSDRERAALSDWAQRNDDHITQALARVDTVFKRINDDLMP